jgi:integrase
MQLRIRNGKGGKERVLPLSERLLKELENYWRAQRQGKVGLSRRLRMAPLAAMLTSEGPALAAEAVKYDGPDSIDG